MLTPQTRILIEAFLIVLFVACLMVSLWQGWNWAAVFFALLTFATCADIDFKKSGE